MGQFKSSSPCRMQKRRRSPAARVKNLPRLHGQVAARTTAMKVTEATSAPELAEMA